MKRPLQSPGNCVNLIKVRLRWSPPRPTQIDPPAPLPRPEEIVNIAPQRRALRQITDKGLTLQTRRGLSAGPEYPPPWNAAAVMAHDVTHLTWPARAQQFRNVTVGQDAPCRHHVNQGKDSLDIFGPHGPQTSR